MPNNIEDCLDDILNAKYGKDVRQSIHDGIELCYTDALASQAAIVNLVSPDKIFRAINADPALLTFTYSSGNYTVSWAVSDKSIFGAAGKKTLGILKSGAASATNIIMGDSVTAAAGSGFYCFFVSADSTAETRIGIKSLASVGKDDYILAIFYHERFDALGNEGVFTSTDLQKRKWDAERLFNPFSKIAMMLLGKVVFNPTAHTVSIINAFIATGINGEYNTSGIGTTENPVSVDYSGAGQNYTQYIYFDDAEKTLHAYTAGQLESVKKTSGFLNKYLLCVVLGSNYIWTGNEKSATWYINDTDVYSASSKQIVNKTCKIFRRVACCGDSYTSGHIVDSNGDAHGVNENYAWPHYMATLTGNTIKNFGSSGANVLTWQTVDRGLPAVTTEAQRNGKFDAFLIGLGINDSSDSQRHVDVGSESDVPSPDASSPTFADTYYGGLAHIVWQLHALSPDAHIFIQNLPRSSSTVVPYNAAMAYIAEHYHDAFNTHLLDLRSRMDLYSNSVLASDARSGHYTAIGYQIMSEALCQVWSDYINAHTTEFIDVAFIDLTPLTQA